MKHTSLDIGKNAKTDLRRRFQSQTSTEAKTKLFLKNSSSGDLFSNERLASKIDAGEPLLSVLEEHFGRCIEIQQNVGNEEDQKLKLSLDFGIFTDNFIQDSDTERDQDQPNSYWFLKLLACRNSLQPLCKHPYITAFLDLHYSNVKNVRTQVRDSIPHLTLMLILLHLASTMPGHLHDNFDNLPQIIVPLIGTVFFFDMVSLIGEKTKVIEKWLKSSLCSPKKHDVTCSEKSVHIYCLVLYLISYFISVATLILGVYIHNYVVTKSNDKSTKWICERDLEMLGWRKILECTLIAYSTLLLALEVIQMKSAKHLWIDYFGHSKNWIDLMQIAFTLTTALSSIFYDDQCKYSWMQNLIYLMVLASFFQLYNDIAHCLPNNDFMYVQQYLHMFYHVSVRYLIILAGFLPLLTAFAWCFHGIADENQPYGGSLAGSVFKAFAMFSGEYDFGAMRFTSSNETILDGSSMQFTSSNGEIMNGKGRKLKTDVEVLANTDHTRTHHQKVEIMLGQLIFVAFIFLFPIVVMNLLNAFAIGDIQRLRNDATAIRNRKKIIELIKQRPEVNRNYCWDIVYHEAEAQSETFLIRYLVVKGFFGIKTNCTDGVHFLPRTTFRKLKNCHKMDKDKMDKEQRRKMLEEISLMKENEEKMLQEISLMKENIEKIQTKLSTL